MKEVHFLHTFPVYEKVGESDAKGKTFVSTRLTLTKKGDAQRPDIQARLVGRKFKWKSPEMEDTFAATPPRVITDIRVVTVPKRRTGPQQLPRENGQFSCWTYHVRISILRVEESCTYGNRLNTASLDMLDNCYDCCSEPDVANAWDEFFNNAAFEQGYEIGLSSPCEQDGHGWRHGDDLVLEAEECWLGEKQKGFERVIYLEETSKQWGGEQATTNM